MKNLKAEKERFGIKGIDIQNLLGCSTKTIKNKLDGKTDFTIPEAFKIRNAFFLGMRLEYLFKSDKKSA